MHSEVLIIGGGLTGLYLAHCLHAENIDFRLLEARSRLGGRILNASNTGEGIDLGPAWFWNGQPKIAALLEQLQLTSFLQYSSGDLLFQSANADVTRRPGMAMMEGAFRLQGGLGKLIESIHRQIPDDSVLQQHRVESVQRSGGAYAIDVMVQGNKKKFSANKVICCLPPRLAAASINFADILSDAQLQTMQNIPTWMAGHAKIVAIYEQAFWRQQGFSGDVISHSGPMVEIHDATPHDQGSAALFGFVGVPAAARAANPEQLKEQAAKQLIDLFGPDASNYQQLILQDWACEEFTATAADQNPPQGHPAYGMPPLLATIDDNTFALASSELATTPNNGGLLEGALEAAVVTKQKIFST